MAEKKKKFKGNNAKIHGDTRLTERQMKKFAAAYHNVQRDFAARVEAESKNPARVNEDVKPANLPELT